MHFNFNPKIYIGAGQVEGRHLSKPIMTSAFRVLLILGITAFITFGCRSQKKDQTSTPELPEKSIEIRDAWARPANQGMMGGAYLTIANGTSQADTLIGIITNVADTAEIHESYQQDDGISGMRPVGKLPVKSQTMTQLKPGGYHIMLMQISRDLAIGDSISTTFYFSRHDSLSVQIPVRQQ